MGKHPASKAFLIAITVSIVLPFVPVLSWLLWPFDLLETHLHEMFHAIAGLVTGGQVDHIEVYKTGAGVTLTRGGIVPIIQMAGYLGGSLFGSLMLMSCRTDKSSVVWLRILGGLVLISNILWVRGDFVGWPVGFAWPIIILFMGSRLKGQTVIFAAQFLAVQQCLNSLKSLRDLFSVSGSGMVTDAQLLANDTHIPAIVWASLWMVVSVVGIGLATIRINQQPESVQGQEKKEEETT